MSKAYSHSGKSGKKILGSAQRESVSLWRPQPLHQTLFKGAGQTKKQKMVKARIIVHIDEINGMSPASIRDEDM